MTYKQIMSHEHCRTMMKQDLEASAHKRASQRHSSAKHSSTHHSSKAKHKTTKRYR